MKIALSKGSGSPKYVHYTQWLHACNQAIEIVDMSLLPAMQHKATLEECDGVVFTGGPDVHPSRYGKDSELSRCTVDEQRDALEFQLIEIAKELYIPVLGICRGAQILNVAYGGTLVVDIPTDVGTTIEHRSIDSADSTHTIEVEAGSVLGKISETFEGTINSAHHQSVDVLSNAFVRSAWSADGVTEAFEFGDNNGNPFLLAVQWHPERMEFSNPFSLKIAERFVYECECYKAFIKHHRYKPLEKATE